MTGVREGAALPLEAVGRMAGTGESVCYVVSDGVARLRVIETGAERDNFLEVLSGLENGEAVIAARLMAWLPNGASTVENNPVTISAGCTGG